MKKLLLTTALAAFLMKSCNRDRHDYEYIPEPPIEEPVCPPDCDCPECYTPEPPVCPPDCDCPECYDNGGGEPPVEPDPCAEYKYNVAAQKYKINNVKDDFRDAFYTALHSPLDISPTFWFVFDFVNPNTTTFRDTVTTAVASFEEFHEVMPQMMQANIINVFNAIYVGRNIMTKYIYLDYKNDALARCLYNQEKTNTR